MHRSERPVRIARSNATATVRTCPSPCAANGSRLLLIYSSCGPGMATPMVSVSDRALGPKRPLHWDVGLQDAHRQRESCRICLCENQQFTSASCVTKESHFFHHNRKACKRQWASASLVRGQSIPLPLAVALGGKCKRNRLQTRTSSRDFGAIRQYARESADRLVPCIAFLGLRR